MTLSAPSLITYLLAFAIVLAVVFVRYFGAAIPGLSSEVAQFAGLLIAYLMLAVGCLVRGM